MLQYTAPLWLFLLTVSAGSINSFHKGISTEKPDLLYEGSPVLKPRKPPTHISEFTDPDTGLNPFLDLEEGPTSAGRNVMKDERREDPPFLDFEIVEGDATERRWGPDIPKQPVEEPIQKWPPFEDRIKDQSTTTTHYVSEMPPTTIKSYVNTVTTTEELHIQEQNDQKTKEEVKASAISKGSILYASLTIVVVAAFVLLAGICWWRRKVKRTTQLHAVAENGELKS